LLGNFYSSGSGNLSEREKLKICDILNCRLTGNMFFESAAFAVDDVLLPAEPDFRSDGGRKFWVYQLGKPLPA
jgi:hypothetical protein